MVENDESINAPKSALFHWKHNNYENDAKSSNPLTFQNLSISLGNMKMLKISRSNQKSTTPKMLIITEVFEEKNDVEAPRQKSTTPRMHNYCRFFTMLMITMVEER